MNYGDEPGVLRRRKDRKSMDSRLGFDNSATEFVPQKTEGPPDPMGLPDSPLRRADHITDDMKAQEELPGPRRKQLKKRKPNV